MRLNTIAEGQLLPPRLYQIELADAPEPRLVACAKPSFDAAGMQSRLIEPTSEDATWVPYHLAFPREAAEGPGPIVMQAYGWCGVPVPGDYLKHDGPALLEKGSGVAVAHISGGCEVGLQWHQQVMDRTARSLSKTVWQWRGISWRGELRLHVLSGSSAGRTAGSAVARQAIVPTPTWRFRRPSG